MSFVPIRRVRTRVLIGSTLAALLVASWIIFSLLNVSRGSSACEEGTQIEDCRDDNLGGG
ncbi:exported hypothetical protein [Nostocoides australiense Ben110]|uniref:Uncharacterized protein n=1 Tax=Nostocoides australiense Ben110 TaxID=1193182 RepID=W6JWT7_9MICO|nr:exported hypothetical protein [Tetrasphaera australiensis Ben110]